MIVYPKRRRRQRPAACPCPASPGMQGVSALVIGAQTDLSGAELRARGMAGMGAAAPAKRTNWVDAITGGEMSDLVGRLDRLELGLKLAIGASLFAGAMTLVALRRR